MIRNRLEFLADEQHAAMQRHVETPNTDNRLQHLLVRIALLAIRPSDASLPERRTTVALPPMTHYNRVASRIDLPAPKPSETV